MYSQVSFCLLLNSKRSIKKLWRSLAWRKTWVGLQELLIFEVDRSDLVSEVGEKGTEVA